MIYALWKRDSSVDMLFWKEILKRIIDITLILVSPNLAFRGHHKHSDELRSGNFLAIIELLAKYDATLSKLFDGCGSKKKIVSEPYSIE